MKKELETKNITPEAISTEEVATAQNNPQPVDTKQLPGEASVDEELSSKDLQKEVAAKEEQVNKQLEALWASGTKEMVDSHSTEPKSFTPSEQQTKTALHQEPLKTVQPDISLSQSNEKKEKESTKEVINETENIPTQKVKNDETEQLPVAHEEHELVATKNKESK